MTTIKSVNNGIGVRQGSLALRKY